MANELLAVSPGRRTSDSESHRLQNVPILVIHAHSQCNCRCVMCDIWKGSDRKSFGLRDLAGQLDSMRRLGVRWVVFSGGEPLLNTELSAMCALLREHGIRRTLLTTGILLGKQAESVSAAFDDVIVSLDGPQEVHDAIRRVERGFERIAAGVRALRELRPTLRITARTTVQKANHAHLRETALAAETMGLDQISFLAADLTSTAFNRELLWPVAKQSEIGLTRNDITVLEAQIETLIESMRTELTAGFVAESPEKLRRLARHFRAHLGLEAAEAPACNAPWVSAVIEVDGTVRPCFFHAPIGSAGQSPLHEVVNGEKARAFRASLDVPTNPTCRNCVCSLNYRG